MKKRQEREEKEGHVRTEVWAAANYFHKQQTPLACQPQNMKDEHNEVLGPAPPRQVSPKKFHLHTQDTLITLRGLR